MKRKAFPVFLAFLAMGFVDAVGPFVSLAKQEFQLSNTIASLIPCVGLSMFGLLSVPAGILQTRYGKKTVLILGLVIALLGVLGASLGLNSFPRFLLTIMLLGAGSAILQVAGNPILRDVSREGKYAQNLSLAQFAKAVGSLSGPIIPVIAARLFGASWTVIFPLYSATLALTLVAVSTIRPSSRRMTAVPATLQSCLALLRDPKILAMTCGIFLYVGAEVSVSSGIPLFLRERFGLEISRSGLLGIGAFFLALTLGRFAGGIILSRVQPAHFLLTSSIVALVSLLSINVPSKFIAVAAVFLTGLGFANIFPLISFSALEYIPDRANEISGLLVTAIVGGAVLPLFTGIIADRSSVKSSLYLPAGAIFYVFLLALRQGHREPDTCAAGI